MKDKNPPNILIFTGFSGFSRRTHNVAKLIKKTYPQSNIDCLVFGKYNYKYLNQVNDCTYNKIVSIEELQEATFRNKIHYDSQIIADWEEKLAHSLTYIAYYERTFVQHTHSIIYQKQLDQHELIIHVIHLLKELDRLVKGKDLVFIYTAASIQSEILYHLSKNYKIKFACMNETRIGYYWSMTDNTLDKHNLIHERYTEGVVTKKGSELLKTYKQNLLKNKKNIIEDDYQKSVVNTKRLNIKNLLRMIVNLIRFSSGDIHYLAPNRKQRIISNIILKYRQKASYKYFNKNVPENKYVYFPLSMIPEASTLIRGTKYYNQISTIKSLSLELPIHWKLVIKEHPSMIGKNPISFYKEINRIFNVVLLHSTFPSKDVIDKSEAVITVTGTTGLEALVLGKKTIVLGSSIYSGLESVFKVESISEIGDILRNAWTELDIEKQEKDMMLFASSLASADTFEDPDEILWTKKAFNPEMNQVDINIYNALMRKLSW